MEEKTYPAVMARILMERALVLPTSDAFRPFDLLKPEEQSWKAVSCAIGFHFYQLQKKNPDVMQRLGNGQYARIGGAAPFTKKKGSRTVMEF